LELRPPHHTTAPRDQDVPTDLPISGDPANGASGLTGVRAPGPVRPWRRSGAAGSIRTRFGSQTEPLRIGSHLLKRFGRVGDLAHDPHEFLGYQRDEYALSFGGEDVAVMDRSAGVDLAPVTSIKPSLKA